MILWHPLWIFLQTNIKLIAHRHHLRMEASRHNIFILFRKIFCWRPFKHNNSSSFNLKSNLSAPLLGYLCKYIIYFFFLLQSSRRYTYLCYIIEDSNISLQSVSMDTTMSRTFSIQNDDNDEKEDVFDPQSQSPRINISLWLVFVMS